jgi:hypothetical protein
MQWEAAGVVSSALRGWPPHNMHCVAFLAWEKQA